jgi:hypothetical protein
MDLIHQLKVCFVVTKMILSAVADTSQMMMLLFNRRLIFRGDVVTFTPRSPKDSLVYSLPILSWLKIVAALLVLVIQLSFKGFQKLLRGMRCIFYCFL